MAVTPAGTPYVESSDNVADYPGVSLSLANHIDGLDGGKVLQVVHATVTTSTSTTSTSYVNTVLAATITPSTTSNKIMIIYSAGVSSSGASAGVNTTIFRGSVAGINLATNSNAAFTYSQSPNAYINSTHAATFLDSPATVAAQLYTVAMKVVSGGSAVFGASGQGQCSVILMEVAA